jgi:hypothetical protein
MKALRQCRFAYYCVALFILIRSEGNTCAQGKKSDEKLDVNKLRGIWRVDHIYRCDGETGEIKDWRTDLKQTFVITSPDRIRLDIEVIKFFEWTVEYDIKKLPIWIDFTLVDEPKKRRLGVLRLDGDKLLIHKGDVGTGVRPIDFKQKKGVSSTLYKCTRIKK